MRTIRYKGTEAEARALYAEYKSVQRDLYKYVQNTVLAQPGYVDGAHIRTICETVQRFLEGDGKGLAVSLPPRHMKTTIISEALPAWWLSTHPQGEVIIASYNQSQARKMARSVRLAFDRESHRRMMPPCSWDVDSADVLQLSGKLNGRPSLIAAGVGSGITGSGADLLIIDDPVKDMADAESATMRDKVAEWYASTAFTRLSPGGKVLMVATRWHHDDLIGRTLADSPDGWGSLTLPAISEDGRALWPERYPLESLEAIRRAVGSRVFEALYQGRPTPLEGGLFKRSWIRYGMRFPDHARRVRYWDKAATSGGGDWTVGVLMAEDEGRYCVEDVVRLQGSPQEVQARVRATAEADGWDVSIRMEQEPGSSGVDVIDLYARRILQGYDFRAEKVTGDKATRANGLAAAMEAGNVDLVRAGWNRDLIDEMCEFPLGEHDDQVDAMSGAFRELSRGGAPSVWVL
jgi:predicted phage terminase large subunit-like protein